MGNLPAAPEAPTGVDTKPNFAEATENSVIATATRILAEAQKLNGAESKPLNWNEWSTGGVEPSTPIRLGDLKAEFPQLVEVLQAPGGPVEGRHDRIDDNTTVSTVGFWRNSDSFHSALQLTLNNEGDPARTIRKVSLVSGRDAHREWDNVGLKREQSRYSLSPDSKDTFTAALAQTDQLVAKVVDSGNFNAFYNTHTDKVGTANWEKKNK